jgi:hypothetical protein
LKKQGIEEMVSQHSKGYTWQTYSQHCIR